MTKEIKKMNIILPTAFLGCVWDYAQYFRGEVRIEAHENYQKRSTRNKCFIKTSQGKKSISVPLKSGKNHQLPIREVKISYEELWIKELKHSLTTNYSASPYLSYYLPSLIEEMEKKHEYLWTLNLELNKLILHFLGIDNEVKITNGWHPEYPSTYLDLRKGNTTLIPQHQYPQLFEEKGQGFIENLSILDLLFCCGPEARIHLINMAQSLS